MLCSPFSHKERGADKTSGAVTLLCSRWIRRLPLLTLLRCNYFHTRPKTFGSSVLYIPSSPFFKLSSSPCRKIFYSRLLYSLESIWKVLPPLFHLHLVIKLPSFLLATLQSWILNITWIANAVHHWTVSLFRGDLLRFVPCVIVWHRKKIFFSLQF